MQPTSLEKTDSAGIQSDNKYNDAISSIQSYCTWAASISTDSGISESLNEILKCCKSDANIWYDTIYPTFLDMPSLIVSKGKTIDQDLSTLIQISKQPTSPELLKAITDYATKIQNTITDIESQITELAKSLKTFHDRINNDTQAWGSGHSFLLTNINDDQMKIAKLNDTLTRLKKDAFRNRKAIDDCNKEIRDTQNRVDKYCGELQIFDYGNSQSVNAVNSAAYLNKYWSSENDTITNWDKPMIIIQNHPEQIATINLVAIQSDWEKIYRQFQNTAQQTKELNLYAK